MPQKPVLKPGKKIQKKEAANRHGKAPKMKKGEPHLPQQLHTQQCDCMHAAAVVCP
jgi:hypothetical protein